MRLGEGEKERERGGEGRGSVFMHLPVSTSQNLTLPSSEPGGRGGVRGEG